MRIVIAGGSGSLGRRISAHFASGGDEVVILTRSPRSGSPYRQLGWDGLTLGPWAHELAGAALINLAGELVDRRPTPANIDLLKRSRVKPTEALVAAAASLDEPPAVWVQASTLAIYGDGGETVLDETSSPADGPPQMAGVARAWEEAAGGPTPAARSSCARASSSTVAPRRWIGSRGSSVGAWADASAQDVSGSAGFTSPTSSPWSSGYCMVDTSPAWSMSPAPILCAMPS